MKLPFCLTPAHAVLWALAGIILLGTLLLMLPLPAQAQGERPF